METNNSLKWRFDISTFRLIGRDLITDRVTALFELIKNCYDANATEVYVKFENVGQDEENSSITISDNGIGMSFEDIRDKWMVIGTSNKRKNKITPAPISRRCVGEKGIGRFAVDKLGDNVTILTKQENSDIWLEVNIDWSQYFNSTDEDEEILFTDIENQYSFKSETDISLHGTTLIIRNIRERWLKSDIKRFISEVSKIASPLSNISYPMNIHVESMEYGISTNALKSAEDINLATETFELNFDPIKCTQDTAFFSTTNGTILIEKIPMQIFGGIKMKVYYFDEGARKKYRKSFPNDQIDGIKIYRDGVITTPFAESQNDSDKKRDILGIDKRLWMNLFDRVSTREIIGYVEITKEGNPLIIDATNRQDFVDNEEYRALKEFIIVQLDALEQYKIFIRKRRRLANRASLEGAEEDIHSFISSVETISKKNPELKSELEPVIKQAKKTGAAVKSAIREKQEAEREFERKESIYMSIMSLQDYAIHITHAVRTTLNKIRDRVEYIKKFFPDNSKERVFKLYATRMSDEFKSLNKVINYMLSYSQSEIRPEDIDLKETVSEVIDEYHDRFKESGISTELIMPETVVLRNTNKIFFRDIFQNLIDNSIKALHDTETKMILISSFAQKYKLIILISDNGRGVPEEKRQWIFGLYNTTTQEEGGAGIGLYIVKTRVESLKGNVNVVDSEYGNHGSTFQIELPFKS